MKNNTMNVTGRAMTAQDTNNILTDSTTNNFCGGNRIMNFLAKRGVTIAALLCGTGGALLTQATAAHAQTYVGDAYGAKISINAALVGGVGATVVDNPDLPSTGSSTPLTNSLLNANVQGQTGNILSPTFTVLNSGTINTSTVGNGGVATSASQIQGLSLDPGLNLNVLGLGGLNLTSLVSADVISSTTTANALGNTGTTHITNLRLGNNSLGNIDVSGASSTLYLNLLGQVSTTASTNILNPDLAQIIINDQLLSGGGSIRTTNALTVKLLQGNALANGTIVVASSTAGFQPAPSAVPEAGSLPLAGTGAVTLLIGGIATVRRRTRRAA